MLILIWFVATPVLVLLGAVALEHMQRALIDTPQAADTGRARQG